MIPANLPSGQYLLIDVPETANDFSIEWTALISYRNGYLINDEELPEGQWELIGNADSVTDEQIQEIVEWKFDDYDDMWWKCYEDPDDQDIWILDPEESFNSWIRSYGKELSKIVVIKKV